MRMAILAGLALVLLAGCGSDDEAAKAASLSGPLTYERGGGIAGRRDRLVVEPNGSATLTIRDRTVRLQLEDAELDRLATDLEAADLPSLPAESTAPKPIPDAFGYRVSYDGATVTTDDPGMPEALRGLVARLGELVERYER